VKQIVFGLTVVIYAMAITAYRTWEFYIIAKDKEGNQSKSLLDKSVQLLAYVGNQLQERTLVSFSSMQGGDPM